MGSLTLGKLIEVLKQADPNKVVPKGFGRPYSYRGIYDDLAFEPAKDVTVASMLGNALSALGKTFEGYKGGDYKMEEWTTVHISKYGESYDYLGEYLLWYMLGEPELEVCPSCGGSFKKPVASNHTKVECLERQLAAAKIEAAAQ